MLPAISKSDSVAEIKEAALERCWAHHRHPSLPDQLDPVHFFRGKINPGLGADPVRQRRDIDLDAFAGEGLALTVQRLVQQELVDEHHR
jgi:hypothetical protein